MSSLAGKLEELGLSSDITHCIQKHGVGTLADFRLLTDADLAALQLNLGERNRVRRARDEVMAAGDGEEGGTEIRKDGSEGEEDEDEDSDEEFNRIAEYNAGFAHASDVDEDGRDIYWEYLVRVNQELETEGRHVGCTPHSDDDESSEDDVDMTIENVVDTPDIIIDQPEQIPTDLHALAARLGCEEVTQTDGITHYRLPVTSRPVGPSGGPTFRRCTVGGAPPVEAQRSMLLLGQTGSGKSTLLDALINHQLGVTATSDVRFHLQHDYSGPEATGQRGQTESQTDCVTAYSVPPLLGSPLPYTLCLVDTPGFGDTRGLERDRTVIDQLRALFETPAEYGIDSLHAVCFVLKSTMNRISMAHRYIMDAVLSLFGVDLAANIHIICTFSDGPQPNVITALDEQQVPYSHFYTVNNSWLDTRGEVAEHFWEMSDVEVRALLAEIEKATPCSLYLSAEVLRERKELERCAAGLQRLVSSCTGKLTQVIVQKLAAHKDDPPWRHHQHDTGLKNPDTSVLARVATPERNMSCLQCETTCRMFCEVLWKAAQRSDVTQRVCDVCECRYETHVMEKWKYDWVRAPREHKQTNRRGAHVAALLTSHEGQLRQRIDGAVRNVRLKMDRLREIALRPQLGSLVGYMDHLIEMEKREEKPGHKDRIHVMEEIKRDYQCLENIRAGGNLE